MATRQLPLVPLDDEPADVALQQPPWRNRASLSSLADVAEDALARAGIDRGPWLAIAFAAGIACWFVLDGPVQWVLAASASLLVATGSAALWRGRESRVHLLSALVSVSVLAAAGWESSGPDPN